MNTGTIVTTRDIDIELPEPAFIAGTKIGTTTGFFCRDSKIRKGDGAYTREQVIAAIESYVKRIAELEAARIAYANEFPPDENGDPDVGSIHENIRKLKSDRQRRDDPESPYNHKRIGWELERTAMGDGFYGNALRVAKDIPGVTAEERSVLDRFASGFQHSTDHVALQDIARKIYASPQPAEPVKCIGCEGKPAPENNPCAVCGKEAEPVKVDAKASVPSDDVLTDALTNLEHDNYEQSYSGYKNRQADVELIRAALAAIKSGND